MKLQALALLLVALPLAMPAATAAASSVDVAMDRSSYSVLDTLVGGVSPVATVTVVDENGAPVAGAAVTVTFLRQVQLVGFVSAETVSGTTDANGVFVATAPQLSGAPGNYMVVASVLGTLGSTTYSVGA